MNEVKKQNYNKFYDSLCKVIKRNMKSLYIRQYEICDSVGIKLSQFCNKINNCNGKFNILEIKLIADELLMSVDELIKEVLNETD